MARPSDRTRFDASRRRLLAFATSLPFAPAFAAGAVPGPSAWPSDDAWRKLGRRVGGRLAPVTMPDLSGAAGGRLLSNPVALGDEPALTQSSGWIDAWQSVPSRYVVAATDARDVAEAVRFARAQRVRLVIRGGGHSYHGNSSAPESLLVWTRRMDAIRLHDAFVPLGTNAAPRPAVSVGAGATWGQVYTAVTTGAGRYAQGGGCTTVGVAGLVQGGGFGSFSKGFGLAAASLLEAEVVTADGVTRVVSAAREPDLFWALKGGGGGTFAVITRVTLATHTLPETVGAAFFTVQARDDDAFRHLLDHFLTVYRDTLFNPHWGEQVAATPSRKLVGRMVFHGLDAGAARAAWDGFVAFVAADPAAYVWIQPFAVAALPARSFWDPDEIGRRFPGLMTRDPRAGASPSAFWWTGDGEQAGKLWHGTESLWLPEALLAPDARPRFVDAWHAATREWPVSLHFNKGLAGAAPAARAASRDTAMNPKVLDAFALAIIGGEGASSYPGLDELPDLREAREEAEAIHASMRALRVVAPDGGCYVYECDYALDDHAHANWGTHVDRLRAIKRRYDPSGLFTVHHGIAAT